MENSFEAEGLRGILHQPEISYRRGYRADRARRGRELPGAFTGESGAGAFAAAGLVVLPAYDLPFRQLRPKGPPMPAGAARDREGVERAVKALQAMAGGPIFAGRPFVRRAANGHGGSRASRHGARLRCCCSRTRSIRRTNPPNYARHSFRNCAPPRCSSMAQPIPSPLRRNWLTP